MDPQEPGDVKIELLASETGSGEILLGQILLKSNELHSLIRQDIGFSSSVCTYYLKSKEGQAAVEPEEVMNSYMVSVSFSVVPNRTSRRKGILDDSVLHGSWGGIRAVDMESIGSKLLWTKLSNTPSAETKWGNHLLFRSGQAILGLPEKNSVSGRSFSSKVFVLTIIAAQHLSHFDLLDTARVYCLVTSSSAKQVLS
jgi:hypothetical protein